MYKLLDKIDSPVDLKKLPQEQLPLLATELREMILETVSRTGGTSRPASAPLRSP